MEPTTVREGHIGHHLDESELRCRSHIYWFINIFVWVSLAPFAVAVTFAVLGRTDEKYYSFFVGAVSFLGSSLFFYIVAALTSDTSQDLWNFCPEEDLTSYLNKLKSSSPTISFYCECSHYVNRRTVSHWEDEPFHYSDVLDFSPDIDPNTLNHGLVRVEFSKELGFADPETVEAFRNQKDTFIRRNKNRDLCFDFYVMLNIKDFENHKMFTVNPTTDPPKTPSPFLSWRIFLIATLLLCFAPYRWWVERKTTRTNFTICKKILK